MVVVKLTQGKHMIIDLCDINVLKRCAFSSHSTCNIWYARGSLRNSENVFKHYMFHKIITTTGPNQIIDHINGSGLDNRRCNLRIVTNSINSRNVTLSLANTSGIKGVSFSKPKKIWFGHIRGTKKMSKGFSIGRYGDKAKALAAAWRREKEIELGYINTR